MSMGAIFFSWRNRHTFVSSILTYQMPFFRLPLCCHLQHGNKNLLNIDGKVQPLLSYHQHPSLTLWTSNNKTGVVTFGTVHQCVCTSICIQLCIRVIYCSTKSKLFLSCYKASKCCGVWLVNFQEHTFKFSLRLCHSYDTCNLCKESFTEWNLNTDTAVTECFKLRCL